MVGNPDVTVDYRDSRVGDVRHSLADITRARNLFDYEPTVGLRDGLKLTIDWWKTSRYAHDLARGFPYFLHVTQRSQAFFIRRSGHSSVGDNRGD